MPCFTWSPTLNSQPNSEMSHSQCPGHQGPPLTSHAHKRSSPLQPYPGPHPRAATFRITAWLHPPVSAVSSPSQGFCPTLSAGPAPSQRRLRPILRKAPPPPEKAPPHPRVGSASPHAPRRPRVIPVLAPRLRRVEAQAPPRQRRLRLSRAPGPPSPAALTREAAAGRGASWRPRSAAPSLTRSTGSESGRGHGRSGLDGRVLGAGGQRGRTGLPEDFPEEEAHPGSVRAGFREC